LAPEEDTMKKRFHLDARQALNEASSAAPCGIAYGQGLGWYVYDPVNGCEDEPEFFVPRRGVVLPLSDTAITVLVAADCARLATVR
jgi:hypothetical protein